MSLGVRAFANCSSLTSITLPAGLMSLGVRAFANCSSLTSITLPAGLTSVGYQAFQNCSSLTSIELPAGFDDGILRSAGVPPSAIMRFAQAVDVD
jgi:high-affinity Fe2+/Pb2+ permease